MKTKLLKTITAAILCLFIGFSSAALAEPDESKRSDTEQTVVTLPEIVCTAEKIPAKPKIDYREYLNEAMASIRESLERIQLINVVEEVKTTLLNSGI